MIGEERYAAFQAKQEQIAQEVERLKRTPVGGDAETNAILRELGTTELRHGITMAELLRRPEISYDQLGAYVIFQTFPRMCAALLRS